MLPPVKQFVSSNGIRIYRIPCWVIPNLTARVYLLIGAGPPTLVDTGTGEADCMADILDGFAQVRREYGELVEVADLQRIIITHAHYDHFGGLAEMVAASGAEVAVHGLDRAAIETWNDYALDMRRRLERILVESGAPLERQAGILRAAGFEPGRYRDVPVTRELCDGQQFDGLRVIHTPGHAPGLVCLLAGDLLLCADHVLAQTIPQQWPEAMSPHTGLARYLDSLDKIGRVEGVRLGLPAHEPVIEDFAHRVEAIRASQHRRTERLVGLLRGAKRPMTTADIVEVVYPQSGAFRAFLALCDVAARVEYLQSQGRVAPAAVAGRREAAPGAVFWKALD